MISVRQEHQHHERCGRLLRHRVEVMAEIGCVACSATDAVRISQPPPQLVGDE